MPFYDDSVASGLANAPPESLPVTVPSPPFSKLFDSALRRENLVGSITESATQPPMGAFDPTFDPWANIKGYEDYARSFVGANNADDVLHIKTRIDKEKRDDELLSNGGWRGALALLAAGTLDPVNLIPLGQVRAVTRAGRALEGAVRGGIAMGAGTALQEVGLQGTQITRPASESLLNVGSGTVLGGVLGGAVGALTRPTAQTLRHLGDSSAIGGMIFDRELAANLPGRRNLEEAAEVFDAPAIQRATAAAGGDAAKVAEDLRLRIDQELSTGGIVEHRNQGGEKVRINSIDEVGVLTDANGAKLTLDDVTGPGHSLEIRAPAEAGRAFGAAVEDPLSLNLRGELSAARAAEIRDTLASLDPEETARLREAGVPVDPEMWKVLADNLEKAEASREGGIEVVIDQAQYLRPGGDLDTISEREAFAAINRAMQAEVARGGDPNRFLDDAIAAGLGADARLPGWAADWKSRLLYAMPMPEERRRAVAGQLAGVRGPIVDEVSRVLMAGGRPASEAHLYGQLMQVRYANRAALRELGESAEELFRRDFPEVARGEAAAEPAPPSGEAATPPAFGLIGQPVPSMPAHRVATAGGQSVEVTPIVVEARDLIASNDPGYDPALQPRQRDRAASQQQVREMAGALVPERLGVSAEADRGAPIVGDDGMVESGNGRVMAIRAAYDADGPAAAAYRAWLAQQGVDLAGFDQPVLVRQRTTPMSLEERADFAVAANRAATLQLSAAERAMADARNLSPDMLDLVRNPENLEAVANRDFVRAFVQSLPQAEQGSMATAEGGLSTEGLARVRHAILARAYGGTPNGAAILSRIVETTQDEIRSISNSLTAAAPLWARLRSDIEAGRTVPEMDLTPELLDAVRRTVDLRNRGQTFADFLRQQDAFDVLPPRVEAFMSMFYDPRGTRAAGVQRITEDLKQYAIEANKVSAERGLDLGLSAITPDELQRRITSRATGGGQRADLLTGGVGAGEGGATPRPEIQRPGAGAVGPGAGTAREPGAGGGTVGAGGGRPAAAPGATELEQGRAPQADTRLKPEGPLGTVSGERDLTVLDILSRDTPTRRPFSRGVSDIAAELTERGKRALRALGVRSGQIAGPAPNTDEILSRAIALEVRDALQRSGHAGDWYTAKVDAAMRLAAKIYPEIATDLDARSAFTAALAVTSQGETVANNVRLADQVYRHYRQNGRFPTDVQADKGKSMNANFGKLNALLDQLGPARTREFLSREFTVRELEAETGLKIGGENKDTRVYGSAILGPKIGQGFFQNLNGNYSPVTMDLWFMRAWGRLTGTLTETSPETLAAQRTRFTDALAEAGQRVPKTRPALERRAEAIGAEHERNFRQYRAEYNSGERTKSELVRSAERHLFGLQGLNESPSSGGQRDWIRARVNRARELLAAEGTELTNADLQAAWWYPEKELYGKLGGRDAEAINVDYATAWRDVARSRGIPDAELDAAAAMGAVERRPGRVGGGTDAGTVAPDGRGGGAVAAEGQPGAAAVPGELEQTARGKIRLATESERALITLFRDADASTFGHEIAHHWLTELFTDAALPDAPAALRKHADDVRAWLGIEEGAPIDVAAQEKFATGFEQYLREGRAPTPELANAFRQFREWLVKIYQTITGLGEPISPEVRALYDRFLTAEEKDGVSAAGGSLSAASPFASIDQETVASALGIEKALVRVSPTLRTGTSPSVETRRISMALADQPLDLKKNVEGIPTAQSAESLIKQFQGPLAEAEVGVDDLFTQYRLGRARRIFDIARLEARDMFGAPEGAMSYSEFRQAVGRAMRRGDEATQPEVAEAAKLLRRKVFDPLKQRAIDAGLMPDDIDTKTAESYLMRVYDSNKIVAQRGQFSDVITRWLASEQAKKDTIRTRVERLLGEYELLQSRAVPRVTRINEIRDELEDLVTSWEGKTSKTAKSALAQRAEAEAGRTPDQPRLASADRAVIAAAEAIANANTRLEEGDLRDIARQIIDRILGSPVGRLPYDVEVPHPSGGPPRPDRAAPRGPLAQRSFMIPDELIEPWLESDSREIARMYTRTMAPDVVLAERFGRTDMEAQLQQIQEAYERLRQGKSEAEQIRLHNQMQADLRDIAAMRDRLRGTYALPADPNGLGNRAFHVIRDLNYLRLLGGMTISAIPDMGRLVMQHGFGRVFSDAIVPMLTGFREFRLAANEGKLAGTALDMVLDTRAMSMADMLDDYGRWTKYERGLKGLTDRFGIVSLMAPWNSAMKQIAGVIGQTRTLEAVEALVAGQPLRQAERTRLASLGISPEMAERIDAQFKAHGEKQENGTWWANSQDWTDRDAIEIFRSALNKEIDTTIVTKGQEVPLWMSGGGTLLPGNVGKMIGQFRSFGLASAQRVMMAGLQKRDMATLNGALLMVGLGMMVYAARYYTNPKAQPLPDPTTPGGLARWIREGVDISGLTGYLFDIHNMIEKASGGGIGISRLTGGPAQSRYANRNTLESILGPTAGLVQDAGQLLGAATKGEWSAGDSSRVRRMIPFQNLIGLRHLFDAAEHGINQAFGIREPPPPRAVQRP